MKLSHDIINDVIYIYFNFFETKSFVLKISESLYVCRGRGKVKSFRCQGFSWIVHLGVDKLVLFLLFQLARYPESEVITSRLDKKLVIAPDSLKLGANDVLVQAILLDVVILSRSDATTSGIVPATMIGSKIRGSEIWLTLCSSLASSLAGVLNLRHWIKAFKTSNALEVKSSKANMRTDNLSGGKPLPKASYKVSNRLSSDICTMLTSHRTYLVVALMHSMCIILTWYISSSLQNWYGDEDRSEKAFRKTHTASSLSVSTFDYLSPSMITFTLRLSCLSR